MAVAYVRDAGLKVVAAFNGANDQTGSFASLPAVGNHVFVGVSLFTGNELSGLNVVTDNQGNTYAENIEKKEDTIDTIGRFSATLDSCKVATSSGTFTVTINAENNGTSTNNYVAWTAVEFSGIDATTHLDRTGSGSSATGDATVTASAANTTTAGVAIGVAAISNDDTDINVGDTPPTGYINIQVNENSNGYIGFSMVYKIYSGSETSSAQWTHDNTSQTGWAAVIGTYKEQASGTPTLEQEGFRWGKDDNTESAHTWEAAQDTNITVPAAQTKLLRALINATNDPASIAYKLKYQKNGSGGYTTVPIGASSVGTTPLIETADATQSGNDVASGSWALSTPTASAGDLLVFCLSWDDSTATTDVTEPAGKNSETLLEVNATPATDASTETRSKVWYCVCTGAWTAGTITFTPSASESWTGAVIRVPAGEFDASTPIGGSVTRGAAGITEANVQHGAFTAGASDGGGKLCVWTSADTDPQTVASGFTWVANTDRGTVSGGFFTRNTVVSNSESITVTTVSTIASDSWSTVAFVIRAPVVTNEIYVATSGNIAAGGEATTARLTAPSGKTTSNFTTGRRWDDENGTDSIDIASGYYTELEWAVALKSGISDTTYYELRVYNVDAVLDTYTVTPRWTVGAGGVALNQVTETDLAQAIAKRKVKAIGQVTETDLAQAISKRKVRTVAQVTETDLAQTIAKRKIKAVNQALETDLAQAITISGPQIISVAQVTETDLAQAITKRKVRAVGQVTETDLAQAIAKRKTKALNQVTETDLAQAITKRKARAVNKVSETDLAQTITKRKVRAVGQVIETDTAQTITTSGNKIIPVTQVTETDLAQAITKRKVRAIAQATETDLAQALSVDKIAAVGKAIETDLAQAMARQKIKTVNQVSETDLAQSMSAQKRVTVMQTIETDIAWTITLAGGPQYVSVLQVTETDMAGIITPLLVHFLRVPKYRRGTLVDWRDEGSGLSVGRKPKGLVK